MVEGGALSIEVQSGASAVQIFVPGAVLPVLVPVIDGVAEFVLPPSVRGGATIHVSDLKLPDPSTARVLVVGPG